MGTYSKIVLSGSTDYQGLAVTGSAPSTGLVIHTGVTGAADSYDEVFLYAFNTVTTAVEAYVSVGPTTATGSRFTQTLQAGDLSGLQPICAGLMVRNAKNVVCCATANGAWNVFGYVNRYAT